MVGEGGSARSSSIEDSVGLSTRSVCTPSLICDNEGQRDAAKKGVTKMPTAVEN